ncbi:nitrogen regulatory protein [Deltaproteobacteria bacterium]|nr:nitrogen regulatory protein [Deltaproteobacteria bacterium]
MYLADYLCPEGTLADFSAHDKEEALRKIAHVASVTGLDQATIFSVLLAREKIGSTGVGEGYAIPHGKLQGFDKIRLFFARSREGIDFASADKKKCHLFFTILAPEDTAGQHLRLLGAIAKLSRDKTFGERLLQARSAAELTDFLLTV